MKVKEISFAQKKWYKKYLLFSFASSNLLQFYFYFMIFIWAEAQALSL